MISNIRIQNFALIQSVEFALKPGLQVITGETGAGKSIILGALRLLLGERADVKNIGIEDQKVVTEAEFNISEDLKPLFDEHDLDFENPAFIRREILPSGKSRAFINDVPVTLDVLKAVSSRLVDIHSQFETAKLFTDEFRFKMIDGLGGNLDLFQQYQTEYNLFRNQSKKLEDLKNKLAEGLKDAEYHSFIFSELDEAGLDAVNLDLIQETLKIQENVGNISENLQQILARFDAEDIGILDSMNEVRAKIVKTGELSHQFTQISERFEQNFLDLKDIVFDLQNKAESLDSDPELMEKLNSQLNTVNRLFLKHNVSTVEELLAIRDELSGKQQSFGELQQRISATEKELVRTESKLEKYALELSKNRKKASKVFSDKMEALLQNLGLEKAKVSIEIFALDKFTAFGKEKIEILFQANSGFPLKPIQDAISGGERSRVMLAVKKIMAENSALPTLILDEIDTGVSGKIADEMGKMMQDMAADMQLIVITHLAQVAAKGNDNYKVVKQDQAGKTQTNIVSLDSAEKLQEIAQLLSGSKITEAALQQAEELMK